MDPNLEKNMHARHTQRLAAGVILILFGTATLLQRWFDTGNYVVLLLGVGMLVWGSLSHCSGWIIPGGVLSRIGPGILVSEFPWRFPIENQNGLFLLCFALGWFLITLLTALFTRTAWWALIPGGIMALIGGGLLVTHGALGWLDLNLVYAVILITIGLLLLATRGRQRKNN